MLEPDLEKGAAGEMHVIFTQPVIGAENLNFRLLIKEAPFAACLFAGPEMKIALANNRMLELWAKNKSVVGKLVTEVFPEVRGQQFLRVLNQVLTTGQPEEQLACHAEMSLNGIPGDYCFDFFYKIIRDASGRPFGVMQMAADVTAQLPATRALEETNDLMQTTIQSLQEKKQAFEKLFSERTKELDEANSKLHNVNDKLAQFAYVVSHDLQEPIRKISTFTQLLDNSLGVISEKSRSYIEKILASTGRMSSLIQDVLSYSQLSQDENIFQRVDLKEVFGSARAQFAETIREKKVLLMVTDLPVIQAIPAQIFQLFSNLLSNSLKYAKTGTDPVVCITGSRMCKEEIEKHSNLLKYELKTVPNVAEVASVGGICRGDVDRKSSHSPWCSRD